MKHLAPLVLAGALALGVSGCETYYGPHGPGPGGYASVDYVDGYYDDYYGPFDAGYWGEDGVFWYRGGDHQFHRDTGGHFHRDTAQGFHSFHAPMGHGGPPMGHADRPDHHD